MASAGIAAVDLLRYSLYILIFAVIVQAVLSWVNPYTPVAPAVRHHHRVRSCGRCAASSRRSAASTSRR